MLVYSSWFFKPSPLAGMWQHRRDLPVWHLTFHLHKSVNVLLQKPIRTGSKHKDHFSLKAFWITTSPGHRGQQKKNVLFPATRGTIQNRFVSCEGRRKGENRKACLRATALIFTSVSFFFFTPLPPPPLPPSYPSKKFRLLLSWLKKYNYFMK